MFMAKGTMHESMLVHHIGLGYKLKLYRIVISIVRLEVREMMSGIGAGV